MKEVQIFHGGLMDPNFHFIWDTLVYLNLHPDGLIKIFQNWNRKLPAINE